MITVSHSLIEQGNSASFALYTLEGEMKLIDRLGERYERLTVIGRAPNRGGKDTNARWVCRCDCGNKVIAYGQDLKRGKVKSCGCWNDERIADRGHLNVTHGMTKTRTYRIWVGMLNRCRNPRLHNWALYGGRGIKVCERWLKFENFVSDMGIAPDSKSLDRVDNNADYSQENCRWATPRQQSANRRNTRMLTYNEVTLTIADWARHLGITVMAMHNRIAAGFPPEKLFGHRLKSNGRAWRGKEN